MIVGMLVAFEDKVGQIIARMPGNGINWYYVEFEDGTVERCLESWLTKIN